MLTCTRCHRPIEEADCYCRHCGKTLKPRMGFWYDHGGILLCALLIGPFALIWVWLSRKITTTAKWLWTIGIIFFSFYLFYSLYKALILVKEMMGTMLTF